MKSALDRGKGSLENKILGSSPVSVPMPVPPVPVCPHVVRRVAIIGILKFCLDGNVGSYGTPPPSWCLSFPFKFFSFFISYSTPSPFLSMCQLIKGKRKPHLMSPRAPGEGGTAAALVFVLKFK